MVPQGASDRGRGGGGLQEGGWCLRGDQIEARRGRWRFRRRGGASGGIKSRPGGEGGASGGAGNSFG
ncbi:MAG: hypothetical protein Ct9H90mP16_17740 [Candidatus Poseidoniales archaeon]|nr:MAG: hypothetical protein Ct9H90mP16_17740 [Candidatus Poseidoniales archaeon]